MEFVKVFTIPGNLFSVFYKNDKLCLRGIKICSCFCVNLLPRTDVTAKIGYERFILLVTSVKHIRGLRLKPVDKYLIKVPEGFII